MQIFRQVLTSNHYPSHLSGGRVGVVVGASNREELLILLRELGRLDLDQLVRDQDGEQALGLLSALTVELEVVLGQAAEARRTALVEAAELEERLRQTGPGGQASEHLVALAAIRRRLAELDAAQAPCHRIFEEARRRCPARPEVDG